MSFTIKTPKQFVFSNRGSNNVLCLCKIYDKLTEFIVKDIKWKLTVTFPNNDHDISYCDPYYGETREELDTAWEGVVSEIEEDVSWDITYQPEYEGASAELIENLLEASKKIACVIGDDPKIKAILDEHIVVEDLT